MSRYRGPKIRILRRLGPLPGFGLKLNQKFYDQEGKKQFQTSKSSKSKKKKKSPFPIRLQEKQKLRYHYGLTEKNLMQYVKKARKKKSQRLSKASRTGKILLNSLEMRLDNIVFQLGFAPTLPAARQLVTHGHILLNGKKRDIPSSQCKVNDLITISKNRQITFEKRKKMPPYLSFDSKNFSGKIKQQASQAGLKIKELLILEYYSRS